MGFPFGAHLPRRQPAPGVRGAGRRAALVAALAVAALLCAGRPARAGTITALLNGTGLDGIINPGADVTINRGDGSTPSVAYHPGVVNWTMAPNGNQSGLPFARNFTTFCIELTQDISPGNSYTYTLSDLASAPKPGSGQTGNGNGMGATKADKIAELWGAFDGPIGTDGTKAAAFQLAIWKIEYDWGDSNFDNFSGGNFRASNNSAAVNQATTWLDAIYNNNNLARAQGLWALTNSTAQDQITQVAPVAAPPSIYLAGAGALCLAGCAWWRRKQAAFA